MTVWGDLIDKLEEQGFGYSMTRQDRDRAKEQSIARRASRGVDLGVTLPDGRRVTRRTTRPYQYAVAVHVPNDELESAHWEIFRWLTNDRALAEAIADAAATYTETQTLDVTKED